MSDDLSLMLELAKQAGNVGLEYFQGKNEVWYKNGNSPVSEADKKIDTLLKDAFASARPQYGWLSEETEDSSSRLSSDRVVIVDPIDGTRGFIAGDKRWCISIAIVENYRPIHGVIYVPALDQTFAASQGKGLILENVPESKTSSGKKPLVTGSQKLIDVLREEANEHFAVADFLPSLAYRLAMVATGHLDGAFARPGASEWDVAAADIILQEAGAVLEDKSAAKIRYNQRNVRLPALLASGKLTYDKILGLAKPLGILQ